MPLDALPEAAFGFLLIFTRIGTMIMIMPAFGDTSISPRIRLGVALAISLVLYALIGDVLPSIPAGTLAIGAMLIGEAIIGIFVGGAARLVITALHVAGSVIAFQSGLAAAQSFDPSQGTQSALMSSFLTVLGVTLIFVADLHHLLIAAMHDSYALFPIGGDKSVGDFAAMATDTVASSFNLGVRLAAPFLVYGIVFNVGLGVIARLMPQLPVFFVALPVNVFMGFVILMFVLSTTMMWFLGYFEQQIMLFTR